MANRIAIKCVTILLTISPLVFGQQRWSRQIQTGNFVNLGGNDWVPLSYPTNERQTAGRVLNFAPLPHHQPPYIPHVFQQQQQQQHQQQQQPPPLPLSSPSSPPQQQQQQLLSHEQHRQPQQINFVSSSGTLLKGEPFSNPNEQQQRFLLSSVESPSNIQFQQQLTPPAPSAIAAVTSTQSQPQQQQQQPHRQPSLPPPSVPLPSQHIQHNIFSQHQQLPSQQPPHFQHQPSFIQHQLSPAEINQQYNFQRFSQQQPPPPPPPQQPKPASLQLPQLLQQEYMLPATPTFLENEIPPPQQNQKPRAEQLVHHSPLLFGQENEPHIVSLLPSQQQQQQPQEEVQLLYVPLNTLYQQQQQQHQQRQHQQHQQTPHNKNKYNVVSTPVNPLQINNFYTPVPSIGGNSPSSTVSPFSQYTSSALPSPTSSAPPQFASSTHRFALPISTTEKPSSYATSKSKTKSHQPPLAMFMVNNLNSNEISVNEVLTALKNAKNIDVLDSATHKRSPKVFVGPSGLRTPNGYTKFELPYLSSIERNRDERQVQKLPFFVAPLSYKTPPGFAKIPLPAPHVGSVVVNSPPEQISRPTPQHLIRQQPPLFHQQLSSPTVFSSPSSIFTSPSPPPPTAALPPQRAEFYPKKVVQQYIASTTPEPTLPPPPPPSPPSPKATVISHSVQPLFRSTSKPNLGFRFGSEVSSTERPRIQQSQFFGEVSSAFPSAQPQQPDLTYEQFEGSSELNFGRFQQYTTPVPKKYSSHNRFPEQSENRNVKPFSSTPVPTQSSALTDEDQQEYNKFSQYQSPSTSSPPFKKYEQVERQPQHQTQHNVDTNAFYNFKQIPTSPNVLNEEYFNIKKSQEMQSFASEQPDHEPNQHQQSSFRGAKDYYSSIKSTQGTYPSVKQNVHTENYFENVHQPNQKDLKQQPEITFTAKPIEYATRTQEIQQMKTFYREQDTFKSRPQIQLSSSTELPVFTSSYNPTQSSLSPSTVTQYFESNQYDTTTEQPSILSITTTDQPNANNNKVQTGTLRSTITYYTPSTYDTDEKPSPPIEKPSPPVHQYKFVESVVDKDYQYNGQNGDKLEAPITPDHPLFTNHRDAHNLDTESPKLNNIPQYSSADLIKHNGNSTKYKPISDSDGNIDDIQYNVPSELPPISASLPGLINSLYEEEQLKKSTETTDVPPATTPLIRNRTPVIRGGSAGGRRPPQPTRATVTRAPIVRLTNSYTTTIAPSTITFDNDDDITTKRTTVIRGSRRPIHYANRTTTVRTPTVRNPNRVRYNPTPEERQRFRARQRGNNGSSSTKDEQNLEYQRDVLKQNYPVINGRGSAVVVTTTTTAPSTTKAHKLATTEETPIETSYRYTTAVSYAHETEKYNNIYTRDGDDHENNDESSSEEYFVPPNHSARPRDHLLSTPKSLLDQQQQPHQYDLPEHFFGLEDLMQIPQEQPHGEFYNSESDITPADKINGAGRIENRPIFQQQLKETESEQQRSPKRPNFAKRPITPRSTTTIAPPITTTGEPSYDRSGGRERYTVRPKLRSDVTTSQYTPKLRQTRIRTRPTAIPTTTTSEATPTDINSDKDSSHIDNNYHQINRFNKDFYQEESPFNDGQSVRVTVSPINEQKKYKFDHSRFTLDTQESQWSTKLNQNSFHPIDPLSSSSADTVKSSKSLSELFENIEPEIVTAGTVGVESNDGTSFLLNVSSNKNFKSFGKFDRTNETSKSSTKQLDLTTSTTESSLTYLLEQVMSSDLEDNDIVKKQEGLEDRNEYISTTSEASNHKYSAEDDSTIDSVSKPSKNSQSTSASSSAITAAGSKRRGVWKRVRVRPVDGFETAESQNIGNQIYNTILVNDSKSLSQQEKDARKGFKEYGSSTSFLGYSLNGHDEDAATKEKSGIESTETVNPSSDDNDLTTAYSPGDIDLGTGAPTVNTNNVSVAKIEATTDGAGDDEAVTTTMLIPIDDGTTYHHEENEDPSELPSVPTTIYSQTEQSVKFSISGYDTNKKEDQEQEIELITELPYSIDDTASIDEKTEIPYYANTERSSFYEGGDEDEDYDVRTDSSIDRSSGVVDDDDEDGGPAATASVADIAEDVQLPKVEPSKETTSIIDEVKQKLTELFSFGDDYDYQENSLKPKLTRYTTIDRRNKSNKNIVDATESNEGDNDEENESDENNTNTNNINGQDEEEGVDKEDDEVENEESDNNDQNVINEDRSKIDDEESIITITSTEPTLSRISTEPSSSTSSTTTQSSFHKNLMDSVIYATSTSTEISQETEICYRGRCIRTDRKI